VIDAIFYLSTVFFADEKPRIVVPCTLIVIMKRLI